VERTVRNGQLNQCSRPNRRIAAKDLNALSCAAKDRRKIEYYIARIEMEEQTPAREWFFRQVPCASIDGFFGYRSLGSFSSLQLLCVLHSPVQSGCEVDEVVSLVGPLEEAADALRSWSENPASFKKIMVSID
jgi:hypothetical protein